MPNQIPTIYSADADELNRKQALANALIQGSLEPIETQSTNGIPAPISPLQGLAKMFQGYQGGKLQREALNTEHQAALARALSIDPNLSGSPQNNGTINQNNDVGNSQPSRSNQPNSGNDVSDLVNRLNRAAAIGDTSEQARLEKLLDFIKPQPDRVTGNFGAYNLRTGAFGPVMDPVQVAKDAALLKSNTTAAEQSNTPRDVTDASGRHVLRYPGDIISPPPAFRPPVPQVPNQQPLTQQPQQPSQATVPIAPAAANPTASSQPTTNPPPQDPWASMPRLEQPQGMGETTYNKKLMENKASRVSELSTKYGADADSADQKLAYNQQALAILPQASVGPFADYITKGKATLQQLGVPDNLLGGSPSANQELKKYLINNAIQGAKAIYGPRMTGQEVKMQAESANPSDQMTMAAIQDLIKFDNIKNQHFINRANDFRQFTNKGGDPDQFESWYAKSFPLAGQAQKLMQSAIAPNPLTSNAQQKQIIRSGIDPSTKRRVNQYSDGSIDYAN